MREIGTARLGSILMTVGVQECRYSTEAGPIELSPKYHLEGTGTGQKLRQSARTVDMAALDGRSNARMAAEGFSRWAPETTRAGTTCAWRSALTFLGSTADWSPGRELLSGYAFT